MKRRLSILFRRWNNLLCRYVLNACGYCGGRLYWLPTGVSVCQHCSRRT